MIGKFDLKLSDGTVIPLHFGMYSQKRFFKLNKELEKLDLGDSNNDLAFIDLSITTNLIIAGAECARRVNGDLTEVDECQAENWVDLAGEDQIKQMFEAWNFFGKSLGEQKVVTPPKKPRKKSPGKK